MDTLDYLFAAFAVVWAGVFGYVLSLTARQRQLKREVNRMERRIRRESDTQ